MTAATQISTGELRELAAFRAARGVVVSLFLGVDPAHPSTLGDVTTRLGSLVAQSKREGAPIVGRLGHAARLAFGDDLKRVAERARREVGPASVACFADARDGLWRPAAVPTPLADLVKIGSSPYLVPLVGEPTETALVAAVSRERGEIYRLEDGRFVKLVDLSEQQPRRHHGAEAWQQRKLERHVDELARRHVSAVAGELDALVGASPGSGLVLAGEDEHTSALAEMLSHDARAALVGTVRMEAHAGAVELAPLVRPLLEQRARDEERVTLESWRSELGRGEKAVQGWEGTIAAASDGRVDVLLFADQAAVPARRCPACGRASAAGETCALDGARLEVQPDALDLVVRLTLVHGGTVRRVVHDAGFRAGDGVGALLRFGWGPVTG